MNNLTISLKKVFTTKTNVLFKYKGFLLFAFIIFFTGQIFGQVTGDYRSVSTGNWNDSSSWQRFDGTSWGTNSYPGSGVLANDVTIRSGHKINLNTDVNISFNSLIIGDETGATDVLEISADRFLNTTLIIIKSDGFIDWLPNTNYTFSLPVNTEIIIRVGGDLDTDGSNCSANRMIKIGTVKYAVCNNNSNNAEHSFQELIDAGGTANLVDTDNDGVLNYEDVDDDNDGIYDTVELANCSPTSPFITSTIFFENFGVAEGASYDSSFINYIYQPISGTYTSGEDVNDGEYTIYNDIQATASWASSHWQTVGDHTTGTGNMGIFNADSPGDEFYRRVLSVVDISVPIDLSFWAMNLDKDTAPGIATRLRPNITVNFEQNGIVVATFQTGDIDPYPDGDSNAWINYTGSFTPSTSDPISIVLVNNELPGGGNDLAIDDILVTQSFCDNDGNGIINSLETDSDGDGCTDANEAYGDANADGELTDNDGLGYYGTGNPAAINADGSVASASYQAPMDANGNSIDDYTEAGVSPVISSQPVDQAMNIGGSATFSTVSTGNTFQWQENTGSGWVNLSDGGNYSGSNTQNVTISNLTFAMISNDYRVIVTDVSFICDSGITSSSASFTIDYDWYEGAIDVTSIIGVGNYGCSTDEAYTTIGASPDRNAGSTWNNGGPLLNRWFKFTAPATGNIDIKIDIEASKGSQRRTQVALWESDGITEVSSDFYDYSNEDVEIGATGLTPGAIYYISVDTYSSSFDGTFTLCLSDGIGDYCNKVFASASTGNRNTLYELSGSTMTPVFTAPQLIGGLAISENGNAYYDNATFSTPPFFVFDGTVQTNTGATVNQLNVGEAADAAGNVYYVDTSKHLRRVNAGSTGVASDLGALIFDVGDAIGPSLSYGDMTFDGNGRLLMYSSVGGTGLTYLYVINFNTLTAKNLGNIGPNRATGVAFDGNGNLITTTGNGATVVSVDFSSITLDGTVIGTVSPRVYDLGSCAAPFFNPDLSALKSVENITQGQNPATLARAGDILEYTIVVSNTGNFTTNSATFEDAIPIATTYVTNSTTLNSNAVSDISGNMPYATAAQINSASQPSGVIVGGGGTATITFRVTVDSNVLLPSFISNKATITYPTVNVGVTTTQINDSNTIDTPTVNQAELSLTKTVDNSNVCVGDQVIFTLTLTNNGPIGINGNPKAEVTDLLPAGFTYVSDSGPGNYDSLTGIWTIPSILTTGGANTRIKTITAIVNATGPYVNNASITFSPEVDVDLSNNSDSVTVTVSSTPAPTGSAAQSFCSIDTPTVADLTATGTSIQWYAAATGGTALASGTPLVDGTNYYASQTVGGCESDTRFTVAVTVSNPAAPTGSASQSFCSVDSPTVADLTATGSGIQWYANATGGSALAATTALVDGTNYYASQTVSGCESDARFVVTVTEQPAPDAGTNGTLTVCEGTTPTNAELFAELGGSPDAGGSWTNAGFVYTYTVTATSPCTVDATSTVTVTESSPSTTAVITDVLISGGNNGAIDVTVAGGTAPYTY